MIRWAKIMLLLLAFLAMGAMCSAPDSDSEPEVEESESAAERLQNPTDPRRGKVGENLRELQIDLDEVSKERMERQNRSIDDATE